jgi:hypothetical protein
MARLKTAFPRNVQELLAFGRRVLASITMSPHFANVTAEFAAVLAQLREQLEKLQHASDEALLGGKERKAFRDAAQAQFAAILQKLAKHVELHADGDVGVLKSSGFDIVEPAAKQSRIPDVLEALQVKVLHGPAGGTIIAKAKPFSYAISYEAHVAKGDPTIPENWGHYGFFHHCTSMELKGFSAGENISLRFRAITPKGEAPWSATHTIMSL